MILTRENNQKYPQIQIIMQSYTYLFTSPEIAL